MNIPNWVVIVGIVAVLSLAVIFGIRQAASPPPQSGDDGGSSSKKFLSGPLPQVGFTAHYDCKTPGTAPTASNFQTADLKNFKPQFVPKRRDCVPTNGQPPAGEKCTQFVWEVSATHDPYTALTNEQAPKPVTTALGEIACPCECVKQPAGCDGEGRHSAGNCVDPSSLH